LGLVGKTPQIAELLLQLEQAEGHEQLQVLSDAFRTALGVDHLVYHWVSSTGENYGVGTYSPEWIARYLEMGYLRIDPVILGCFQRFHPVEWKRLDWTSKAAKEFRKDAVAYGVGNQGFSVPIRGPNGQFALFTVSHNCDDDVWEAYTRDNRDKLILVAHYFNQKALEFEPVKHAEPGQSLSPREAEVMTLLAAGFNRAQAAERLQISEHTLRVYIESARFKLGAMNTTHAVARALSRGLIVI